MRIVESSNLQSQKRVSTAVFFIIFMQVMLLPKFSRFVKYLLTVINKQRFSLIAPQHPKKAMTKIMEPITIVAVGATSKLYSSGITSVILSYPTTYKIPMANRTPPAA